MRILFLHAGKKTAYESLKNPHYAHLIQNELKAVTRKQLQDNNSNSSNSSAVRVIEDFPTSSIVALILFSHVEWCDPTNTSLFEDLWCTGPVCYFIQDVFVLPRAIKNVNGKLGFWHLPQHIITEIETKPEYATVRNKIKEWQQTYKEMMYHSANLNEISAITDQQPFVEAIIQKKKKTENRSTNIGNVTIKKVAKPIEYHCRFCANSNKSADNKYCVCPKCKPTKKKYKKRYQN